jgi:ribosomal-protein-alanine N-acetyltransferase
MREDDLEAVQAIDRLSFSLPWPDSAFRYELLDNTQSFLHVAEIVEAEGSPRVVGAAVIWMVLDEAHIATIAVHPDYRQRGIARQLMVDILKESYRRGAELVTLEVRQNNLPAQMLYRRFRFDVVGHRPHYYQDNHEDALIMTLKELNQAYIEWLDRGGWMENGLAQPG